MSVDRHGHRPKEHGLLPVFHIGVLLLVDLHLRHRRLIWRIQMRRIQMRRIQMRCTDAQVSGSRQSRA
eukprot:scaffold1023_cov313-Pinguiococcus_pyrenoidosus.AAC.27